MKSKALMPLSMVSPGQKVRLVEVNACQNLSNRLASMGLLPNVEIQVVKNTHPGPFIIKVKGSNIILGRGMANKIMVK